VNGAQHVDGWERGSDTLPAPADKAATVAAVVYEDTGLVNGVALADVVAVAHIDWAGGMAEQLAAAVSGRVRRPRRQIPLS
jgi:hypothetical protein